MKKESPNSEQAYHFSGTPNWWQNYGSKMVLIPTDFTKLVIKGTDATLTVSPNREKRESLSWNVFWEVHSKKVQKSANIVFRKSEDVEKSFGIDEDFSLIDNSFISKDIKIKIRNFLRFHGEGTGGH